MGPCSGLSVGVSRAVMAALRWWAGRLLLLAALALLSLLAPLGAALTPPTSAPRPRALPPAPWRSLRTALRCRRCWGSLPGHRAASPLRFRRRPRPETGRLARRLMRALLASASKTLRRSPSMRSTRPPTWPRVRSPRVAMPRAAGTRRVPARPVPLAPALARGEAARRPQDRGVSGAAVGAGTAAPRAARRQPSARLRPPRRRRRRCHRPTLPRRRTARSARRRGAASTTSCDARQERAAGADARGP